MYHPKDVFEKPEEYLDFILSQDFEGQFFERKEIVTDINRVNQSLRDVKEGLTATISAFANYNQTGGLIVIGINDKTKEVTGLEHLNDNQFQNLLTFNNLRNHHVLPKSFYITGKLIYLLYVSYLENAVCETLESVPKAWKRMGKSNAVLNESDKLQILRDKRVLDWEGTILDAEYYEDDVDKKVAESFKRGYLQNSDFDLNITEILKQIGAIRRQNNIWYWTNAGILFFDKSPQRMVSSASVRFLRHEFLLRENPHLSDTTFDRSFSYASLPTLLAQIRTFCRDSALFRTFYIRHRQGQLQEIPQFPQKAVEEAIINAMVHRDYAVKTETWCRLYQDAFVVENAGRILQTDKNLPNEFTLEKIDLVPTARNRNLVNWLKYLKDENGDPFVRGISEGTRNMKNEMQKMYFPFPKYFTNGITRLTLQSVSSSEELENYRKNFL